MSIPPRKSVSRPAAAMARLGVKHSKFFADFVRRAGAGEFIPGTRVRRLHLLRLGPRTSGVDDTELDAVIEALVAEARARAKAMTPPEAA